MANPTGKGGFGERKEHIWRGGRPKSFDALRELALQVGHEVAKSGGQDVVIDGHRCTVTEAILRQWASSKDWQRQKGFIEIAYGKVPDKIEVSDGSVMRVVIDLGDSSGDPGLPSGASGDIAE